jgi:LysR family transcriptional regulator of abg operon
MKLTEIQNFIAVADSGSIRSAARLRGLSAPAMTKSISRLEEKLEASLVVRTTRGAVITEFGEAFLRRARIIAAETINAREEIAQLQGRLVGSVAIGVSITPAMTIVPPALMEFRRQFPQVNVRIVDGPYSRHLPAMRDGTLDFAVAACPLHGLGTEFQQEELFVNELAIVTRPGCRWSRAQNLEDLHAAEWVTMGPATHGQGAAIVEAFGRRGLEAPRSRIVCESIATMQTLLAEADVICVLPVSLLAKEPFVRIATRIKVSDLLPTYTVSLIQRAQGPLKPMAAKLAILLQRHAHYFSTAAAAGAAAQPATNSDR